VTYHKDIRAVLETNCLSCHVAAGVGPFPLDSWDSVHMVSVRVVGAVSTGALLAQARVNCARGNRRDSLALKELSRAQGPCPAHARDGRYVPCSNRARPAKTPPRALADVLLVGIAGPTLRAERASGATRGGARRRSRAK
jgi:hypothetical protein